MIAKATLRMVRDMTVFFFSHASLKFNTFRIEPIDKQCPHEVDISGEALLT